jgi:hypothetical protein
MDVRFWAMTLMAAALAGCTNDYGGYHSYPAERYYDDSYYGGGFGYGSYHDHDDYDRYFHPARNVSCDRARDICYDRYGPSYHATARYLGERDANRAYKKYGDSVFLFSPRPGVSCDRRTQECSDGQWTAPERKKRMERGYMGSLGSGSGFDDDDTRARRVAPARRNSDDDAITRRAKPRIEAPPPMADNDDDVARPARRVEKQQPRVRPKPNAGFRPGNGGGSACPPRGCPD